MVAEVERQLVVGPVERESAVADAPGPRHHRVAAPPGGLDPRRVADEQRGAVNGQLCEPSAEFGSEVRLDGAGAGGGHAGQLQGGLHETIFVEIFFSHDRAV